MEKLIALARELKTEWAIRKAARYIQLLLEKEGQKVKASEEA